MKSDEPFQSENSYTHTHAGNAYTCALSHSGMSDSLQFHGLQPTRLLCPWGFSRQECWSELPCPPPGALPNPGTEPRSPALQVDPSSSEPPGKTKVKVSLNVWHFVTQTRILEWVASPFSRGSSWPWHQTQVSHIAGNSLPSEPPRKHIYIFYQCCFISISSFFSLSNAYYWCIIYPGFVFLVSYTIFHSWF